MPSSKASDRLGCYQDTYKRGNSDDSEVIHVEFEFQDCSFIDLVLASPSEDAPDIVANTFLSGVSEQQLGEVALGFLAHPQRK